MKYANTSQKASDRYLYHLIVARVLGCVDTHFNNQHRKAERGSPCFSWQQGFCPSVVRLERGRKVLAFRRNDLLVWLASTRPKPDDSELDALRYSSEKQLLRRIAIAIGSLSVVAKDIQLQLDRMEVPHENTY